MGENNSRLVLFVYNHTVVCKVIYHQFRHESRFGKDILKMIVGPVPDRGMKLLAGPVPDRGMKVSAGPVPDRGMKPFAGLLPVRWMDLLAGLTVGYM